MEALTPEFGQVFWDFVKEGGYENRQKSGGKPQFYRFSKPEDPAFPAMSEGVRADMRRFLEAYESDPVDPKALKIKGVGAQQVVEVLKSVYLR